MKNDLLKRFREVRRIISQPRSYNSVKILKNQNGHDLISKRIQEAKPFMISRLGSVELSCLHNYHQLLSGTCHHWNNKIRYAMNNNAGFFPSENQELKNFSQLYFECLKHVDVMGVWYNEGERQVCEEYCKSARFVELRCIEPYYFRNPWSSLLEQKTVVVVHPFEKSIIKQFEKREFLFPHTRILPKFELLTLKAIQSRGQSHTQFKDWFAALDFMKLELDKLDFDIAIIGAGAYGLPLAAHIKLMGKQAVHMGGATQILFGIKGKRWDDRWVGKQLYNKHWIRPTEIEGSNATGNTGQDYW